MDLRLKKGVGRLGGVRKYVLLRLNESEFA